MRINNKRSSMRQGNPITNNLPANLDSFLMDMAQMVGPFDYSDIMHFANKISDVKTDKNVKIIRKLYAAAKDAKEYDDDEELSLIGEDLNDILTGVKDFNKPGMIFADTRTFKYEDSQNSEYNDLGTDTRTGERFPGYEEDEDDYAESSRFLENTIKFNPSEVKVIHDRMEVENEWGKSVYEPRDLRLFKSIMDKCAKNTDGNINFTSEELKIIEDRLDIECHEWGGKAYDEHDLEDMEMVLGKIRRSRI